MNAKDWSIPPSLSEVKSDMAKVAAYQLTDDDYIDAPEFNQEDMKRAVFREAGIAKSTQLP
jgi:hypothetical protein